MIALLLAQAAIAPLAATGPWTVLSEPAMCTLSRDYGTTGFGLSAVPAADVEVAFVGTTVRKVKAKGRALLHFSDDQAPIPVDFEAWTRPDRQTNTVTFKLADATLARFGGSAAIWLEGDGVSTPAVRLGGLPAGLAALDACRTKVAADLGIDLAALRGIVRPAMLRGDKTLIPANDYPSQEYIDGKMGVVTYLWSIDAQGQASNCRILRSSGSKAFEREGCRGILRGRYDPARDAAGRAVPSIQSVRIRWELRY